MIRILSISGSLRAASCNSAILDAARRLTPEMARMTPFGDLGFLPQFNPDRSKDPPTIVCEFFDQIRKSHGLLLACPEYARGLPGAFKNALDWLVDTPYVFDMPVAIFNVAARPNVVQASLRLVLETMSMRILEAGCMRWPLGSNEITSASILADPQACEQISMALKHFIAAIRSGRP